MNNSRTIVEYEQNNKTSLLSNRSKKRTGSRRPSKAVQQKHKQRQIDYERNLQAYIFYIPCKVDETSAIGRRMLRRFYKEHRTKPTGYYDPNLSLQEYRRQFGADKPANSYIGYCRAKYSA